LKVWFSRTAYGLRINLTRTPLDGSYTRFDNNSAEGIISFGKSALLEGSIL